MRKTIGLTCFHCGNTTYVEVEELPRFAFQVAGWANQVGMLGLMDLQNSRSLIFCNKEHAKAEMTKKGTFRVRAKGVPAPIAAGKQS